MLPTGSLSMPNSPVPTIAKRDRREAARRSEAKKKDGDCMQARARASVLQKVRKRPRNRHVPTPE